MATYTPNYNLPKYDRTDRPNLLGGYNSAMDAIDAALHDIVAGGDAADYVEQRKAAATTVLDAAVLGESLYVDPVSGLVFYKPTA